MGNYTNLNVLSRRKDYMTDDAIQDVANMINASGASRSQRRRLERTLRKTENIMEQTQKRVDMSSYNNYKIALDDTMRRFFSVLGIVLKNKYGFEETETKEEISTMFTELNSQLEEYVNLTTDEVAMKCYEETGLELIAQKWICLEW